MKSKTSFVLGFLVVFVGLAGKTQAGAFADIAPLTLAAAPADDFEEEDDEDDEEEDDYQDRVRQMQTWLSKRQAERRQSDGGPIADPGASSSYPDYFERHGYDEQGYRRLDAPPPYYYGGWRRHHGRHGHYARHSHRRGGHYVHVRDRGHSRGGRHATHERAFAPARQAHAHDRHARSPVRAAPRHAGGGKSRGGAKGRSKKR